MSKQMVHRWCRQFSQRRQSAHDGERSGRPSLINVDLVEFVKQRVRENCRFMIAELRSRFPQISRSLLHEIVTKHLLFKKLLKKIQKIEDVCHTLVVYHRVAQKLIPRFSLSLSRQMSQFWW
ncbi:uncharacterized protein TNCV_4910701 [Trichonephila clavipes]|nr:uncharacterized protein TNCV_4910701 [Trichonephila clavipes]